MLVSQLLNAVDIALPLGLREGGYEFIHRHAALAAVAVGAGGDHIVNTPGTTHGARNDVVIRDALGGERRAAIDAAAVGFLGKDGEVTGRFLVFLETFPAPQDRESLQQKATLISADAAAPASSLNPPPICQASAKRQRAGILRNAQLVFVTHAGAAYDCFTLHAGILAGTPGKDPGHGPGLVFLPAPAAEETPATALLEQQIALLILGDGVFFVTDVAGGTGVGHCSTLSPVLLLP